MQMWEAVIVLATIPPCLFLNTHPVGSGHHHCRTEHPELCPHPCLPTVLPKLSLV